MYSQGHDKASIREHMREIGYSEHVIEHALKKYKKREKDDDWAAVAAILLFAAVVIAILCGPVAHRNDRLINMTSERNIFDQLVVDSIGSDVSVCGGLSLKVMEAQRQQAYDSCVTSHALYSKNIGTCDLLGLVPRIGCRHGLAELLLDFSLCDGDEDCNTLVKDRWAVATRDFSSCASAACERTLAILLNVPEVCGLDAVCSAVTSGFVGNCKDIGNVKRRGDCFFIFTLLEGDTRYCHNVPDSHGCAIDMADIFDDLSVCTDDFEEVYKACQDRLSSFNSTRYLRRLAYGRLTVDRKLLDINYRVN